MKRPSTKPIWFIKFKSGWAIEIDGTFHDLYIKYRKGHTPRYIVEAFKFKNNRHVEFKSFKNLKNKITSGRETTWIECAGKIYEDK